MTASTQLPLIDQSPRERVLELLQAQKDGPGRYPFITHRTLRSKLDLTGDDLRAVIEPMEQAGEIVVGFIHNCPSYMEGMETGMGDCTSRPHFIDRTKLPADPEIECVGCGELVYMDDVREDWRDPFRGTESEVTVHLPEDTAALEAARVRNYNLLG